MNNDQKYFHFTMEPIDGSKDEKPQDPWDASKQVTCPRCGFECTHMQMVSVKQGIRVDVITRNESIRRVHDDMPPAWYGRGSEVRISMWCESGHSWDVVFSFHKGSTCVYVESLESETIGHTEELWRN